MKLTILAFHCCLQFNCDCKVFDCDFNQQLGYEIGPNATNREGGISVLDLESLSDLEKYGIRTDNHCFGCTAGMGSSCQGVTI